MLCPIDAKALYFKCTALIRHTENMFVCFGDGVVKRYPKRQVGRDPPTVGRPHFTHTLAVSAALLGAVSVEDVLTAVTWLTWFYFLEMTSVTGEKGMCGSVVLHLPHSDMIIFKKNEKPTYVCVLF